MKVLLDECLPKKLKYEIVAEVVRTVPEAGWAGALNGEMLKLAEKNFDTCLRTTGTSKTSKTSMHSTLLSS